MSRSTKSLISNININLPEKTDCAIDGVCVPTKTREIIKKHIVGEKDGDVMEHAKRLTNCTDDSCVLEHPKLKFNLTATEQMNVEKTLNENFKVRGPSDTRRWLSNMDIDKTLEQWAVHFPKFFNCHFACVDFMDYDSELSKINLAQVYKGEMMQLIHNNRTTRQCDTFACIVNTDTHFGGGIHWVTIFVDMREAHSTIEFFDSTGNPPPDEIIKWGHKAESQLQSINQSAKFIPVTRAKHQRKDTECGVYSLFYVRSRLEGIPYIRFMKDLISDDEVVKFRKLCFRN